MQFHESGPEFEPRALEIARAIHDPLGIQGSVMYKGVECDAVFIGDEVINAYEFTTRKDKAKAQHDAEKLRHLLTDMSKWPENKYKTPKGWFVTKEEPTADQRSAVLAESNKADFSIFSISIKTLQKRICDAEGYLRQRALAPFGSTVYTTREGFPSVNVDPIFAEERSEPLKIKNVAERLIQGNRILLTGDFGVGKSHALRSLFIELRKRYLKNTLEVPFPIHINLSNCFGLRTPVEILRRHAGEVDFDGDKGLISAWRAGACCLLLDGFDELVPQHFVGGASDLREVRWQAFSAVRSLIEETPNSGGIIISGRPHFFSSASEMISALNLGSAPTVLALDDFNESQLEKYKELAGITKAIPDWVPARPLLLGYLYADQDFATSGLSDQSVGQSWRTLLEKICQRETKTLTAVRPEVIKQILCRVATLARSKGNELGPVGMDEMRRAFYEINGREPGQEGLQALLRLPGLAVDSTTSGEEEKRVFVDSYLAGAAYGEDLAAYVTNHHDTQHPLYRAASWLDAADEVTIDVAASAIAENQIGRSLVLSVIDHRQSNGWSDVVVSDIIRVADASSGDAVPPSLGYMVEGVIFDFFSPEGPVQAATHFRDCLINTLDLGGILESDECPTFDNCSISFIDGVSSIPPWLSGKFIRTDVASYSQITQTTAGILTLDLPYEKQVALTILKKIYSQRGSARKESALYRGLDQQRSQLVGDLLSSLVAKKWIGKGTARGTTIYRAVKGMRAKALEALDAPQNFKL